MKKLILALLLTTSFAATAQHNHRHYNYNHRYYKPNNNWIAPALIGTVIGGAIIYGATRPQYYAPPPVVYAPQNPVPPYGFHYENIVDSACNCVRTILVPN